MIKLLKSSTYDHENKIWTISIDEFNDLATNLQKLSKDKNKEWIVSLPGELAKSLSEQIMPKRTSWFDFSYNYHEDFDLNPNLNDIPEKTLNKLLPFQRQGVIFGISKKGRFLLGDEMGVGKTLQAISTALVYWKEWPLLILCPSALRLNWKEEIFKWTYDIGKGDV